MLAVPHLVKTQGNIVNVSSVNGLRSVSYFLILFTNILLSFCDYNFKFYACTNKAILTDIIDLEVIVIALVSCIEFCD